MQRFCASRVRAPWLAPVDPQATLPATLHAFRDPGRIRSTYPVCTVGDDPVARLIGLNGLFAELADIKISGDGEDSDQQQSLQHALSRIESTLRTRVEIEGILDLEEAWKTAREEVLGSVRSRAASHALPRLLNAATARLPKQARLLSCSRQSLLVIFRHALTESLAVGRKDALEWSRSAVDHIRTELAADDAHAQEALSPDRLGASLGTTDLEELDLGALSSLLQRAPRSAAMPADRRRRLEALLDAIGTGLEAVFGESGVSGSNGSAAGSLPGAFPGFRAEIDRRTVALIQFCKSVRLAELEVENRYVADRHDAFFASFDWATLTDEERALLPPMALHLDADAMSDDDIGALLGLLSTSYPVKILVTFGRVTDGQNPLPVIRTRVAELALQLGSAYVVQMTASNVDGLLQGFRGGLAFQGPALFSVYVDPATQTGSVPSVLRAAASADAGALVALTYDPAAGGTWADRFRMESVGTTDDPWPSERLSFATADGEEADIDVAFTYADFLLLNEGFQHDFAAVAPTAWVDEMLPVSGFLTAGQDIQSHYVPFVWLVSPNGELSRALVTYRVAEACGEVVRRLKALRELAGLENSFVRRAVEETTSRLEREKQEALTAQKAALEADLQGEKAALAETLISNLAGALLDDVMQAGPERRSAPPPRAREARPAGTPTDAPPASEAPAAEAAEPEADDLPSLDEAYIETPRCTSCNECTTINPRMFAYNDNKQAFIKDISAGTYRDLVLAAEKCPVFIIHPGKPINPNEPNLDELIERAARFR